MDIRITRAFRNIDGESYGPGDESRLLKSGARISTLRAHGYVVDGADTEKAKRGTVAPAEAEEVAEPKAAKSAKKAR